MLLSDKGKFVHYSECGQYVLVVFSRPLGYPSDYHMMCVLKKSGTLQQYGPFVFSELRASEGGQRDYFGLMPSAEVREKHGPKVELVHFKTISHGWMLWRSRWRFEDSQVHSKVEFHNVPDECPLVDGEGWKRFQSRRNSDHYLSVRETPYYNDDIYWNNFASKSGALPFHFCSFGYMNPTSAETQSAAHGLIGHVRKDFNRNFDLTEQDLVDPTLRDELRV